MITTYFINVVVNYNKLVGYLCSFSVVSEVCLCVCVLVYARRSGCDGDVSEDTE